jgi:molybdenum cofactor cytidylyltransferase
MRVAALILAAGASSRYAAATGGENKLLADFGGTPVIARVADAALASRARPVLVVVGHQKEIVRACLADRALRSIVNLDFATGMASSLKLGFAALPADCDGVIVLLGDMPLLEAEDIDAVIAAFEQNPGAAAIVPSVAGEWAHPVLLARKLFAEIATLTGDRGARALLRERTDIVTLERDKPGLLADADTPEALAAARRLATFSGSSR